jgi:RNA polymerase sigma-70 factor (ECF subfamily)
MSGADLSSLIPEMLPRLWAFAFRLTGDQHDAEDLVQRGCLRALERAHQLQAGTAPLSWMFSIVHSIWNNELRARNIRRRSSFEWDENFLENLADPVDNDPETRLMHAQIIGAIEQLPEAQRVVVLLIAVEGMTYREAADVLDVPIGTVMSRLSRARQALGSMIGTEPDLQSARMQKDSLA